MRTLLRNSLLAGATMLLAAACSGDSNGGNTNPDTPSITVAAGTPALTVARGANGTSQITVGRAGNYTGTVQLAAENVPTGVTVTFAPASLPSGTNSSVMGVTVAANATPGTSNITVRASGSGVTDKTATVALTIPAPTMTLALGATTAAVTQGASTTVPVTITRGNGFDQTVTLTAEGLPAGVTASFNPATLAGTATTSTLTLTAAAGATAGTANVTVRAAGQGVTDQTATVALTVNAAAQPDFSLSATPAALNVTAGQNGTSTININRTGGFAGAVALTVAGAPTGVTATLNPTSPTGATSTLSITTTAATVAGTYNLTISGTGTGVTGTRTTQVALTVATPPGLTLTLTPAALSITQAQNAQTVIVVNRTGGLTGNIDMTVEGAPAGVTTSFNPNPATGASTTLTVNVAQATAPGNYTLTVRGTGAGGVVGTSQLQLTVTAASAGTIAINTVPQAITIQQGQQNNVTVNITRGGGFSGVVNLAATGVPAGVTATFTPQAAAGAQSTLGFNVGAGAVPGTYTVTVTGTATGLQDATTTLQLTVSQAGGGSGNVVWGFCDASRIPLWFAFRNGATGAWTRVTANAQNQFIFNVTADVAGVAMVLPNDGGTHMVVFYNTRQELISIAQSECTANPGGKTVTGTVQGLALLEVAGVSMGGSFAQTAIGASTYQLTGVRTGPQDLIATRMALSGQAFVPNRMLLLRNQDIPNGGTVPVLNFGDASSFAPAMATITLSNAGSTTAVVGQFVSPSGATNPMYTALASAGTVTYYGIPTDRLGAQDLHGAIATTLDGTTDVRIVNAYFREVTARAISFGPLAGAPSYTSTTSGGLALARVQGAIQTEYGAAFGVSYSQNSGVRNVTITASRGYIGTGASQYDMSVPDLAGVTGFNNAWGLLPSVATDARFSAIGGVSGEPFVIANGSSWRTASKISTVTF